MIETKYHLSYDFNDVENEKYQEIKDKFIVNLINLKPTKVESYCESGLFITFKGNGGYKQKILNCLPPNSSYMINEIRKDSDGSFMNWTHDYKKINDDFQKKYFS